MRVHYLQHVPFEGPGSIAGWCDANDHHLTATRLYTDEAFPELATIDVLVVLGGPMGVNDDNRYVWLGNEKRLLREAIDGGVPILGICLGAQLIANVLGAEVRRNSYTEIGWHSSRLTTAGREGRFFSGAPPEFTAFHWHGDTFDIPPGAQHLASSEACGNQAFLYDDRVLGLQFHLETEARNLDALIRHCGDQLVEGRYIQTAVEMQAATRHFAQLAQINHGILTAFEDLVRDGK